MKLCDKCGSLMWGENCSNEECDNHYITDMRALKEMCEALNELADK
jgi:hypothetical protein